MVTINWLGNEIQAYPPCGQSPKWTFDVLTKNGWMPVLNITSITRQNLIKKAKKTIKEKNMSSDFSVASNSHLTSVKLPSIPTSLFKLFTDVHSLDSLDCVKANSPCTPTTAACNNNMESTMYYDDEDGCCATDSAKAKSYLSSRLYDEYRLKDKELEKAYHIHDDEMPATVKEAVERIKSGKFTPPDEKLDEEKSKESWNYRWYQHLTWRDPAFPKDKDGYEKAEKVLLAARNETSDIIKVLSEEKGLEALNAFKAKTFH